jgi:predicted aconitase with swiveling domain
MERGEVDIVGAYGLPGILVSHPGWVHRGEATIIYQASLKRHRLLPHVPALPELAQSDEGRQVLHAAASQGRSLDAFVVRKAEKAHGLQRRIEGPDVTGRRVLAVEDTSTTGASVLTAVDALREAGADVVGVAVLVERGARDRVTRRGLPFRAAYDVGDLGVG